MWTIKNLVGHVLNLVIIGGIVICGMMFNDYRRDQQKRVELAKLFSPVVYNWVAEDWKYDDTNGWNAIIVAEKADRPGCALEDVPRTANMTTSDEPANETSIVFIDDKNIDSDRPPGIQSFGRWAFPEAVKDAILIAEAKHKCRGFTVKSPVGPFIVGVDGNTNGGF